MPRPLKVDRPRPTEIQFPESVYAKLQMELYSEVEGKVPHGEMTKLMTGLAVDWLKARGVVV